MARADLILNLVQAGAERDDALFKRTVEAIIAEERAKQHHVLANNLEKHLQKNGSASSHRLKVVNERVGDLLVEVTPRLTFQDLILSEAVREICLDLVEEQHRKELLRSYNLEPRHRLLLVGPPGNGKTSLAEALAEALMVPLFVVRYEGIIGAYLGETAVRLKRLFEFVRTLHCVLFFDEFDTLGKERSDNHETGEIKRVVSSLLLQIDTLPSHVIVTTATNHPELLDRAVWRRFQVRLALPRPSVEQRIEWFERFCTRLSQPHDYSPCLLAEKLEGASFSEMEEFGATILRQYILALPNAKLNQIISHSLDQWQAQVQIPRED